MLNRFYPGDPCPECTYPLERQGRSILTLFLREPHLKCPHCKLVFARFSAYSRSIPQTHTHSPQEERREPLLNH
jgi:hypothetical protein